VTSLYRHLLRQYLLASLVPLVLLGAWLTWDLERRQRAELRREVFAQAKVAARLVENDVERAAELLAHVAGPVDERGLRLTVIRADGLVIADTHQDAAQMENHGGRPEVRDAINRGQGSAERHSTTLGEDLLYAAVAIRRGPAPWGVVRGAIPLHRVHAEVIRMRWTLAAAFGLAAIAASVLASRFSGRLSEPLDAVSRTARQVQEGRWGVAARPSGPAEIRELAGDVNRMVERLRTLVQDSEAERGQLEAIVAQMDDGLVVLDREGRVIRLNAAARRILEVEHSEPEGRTLLEIAPLYALDAAGRKALAGHPMEPVEFRSARAGTALRVLASPLAANEGAVLLVQDLTEIRRIDQMRRDFVANVSHELRTPIAGLRALAETLVLRAQRRPEIVSEYAERMAGEIARMGKLVEDLLTLSRLESGRWDLRPEPLDPAPLLEAVVLRFREASDAREIALSARQNGAEGTEGAEGGSVRVRADRTALEMALANLVDNALKYTGPGGEVELTAEREEDEVVFAVSDTGAGIPPEDLPRIFERFYRVDRARSREIEGTGLGLAIVKHLCEAHGGRLWVESEPGRGSRFYLALPAAKAAETAQL